MALWSFRVTQVTQKRERERESKRKGKREDHEFMAAHLCLGGTARISSLVPNHDAAAARRPIARVGGRHQHLGLGAVRPPAHRISSMGRFGPMFYVNERFFYI
jgi:hypothetical protein